MPKLKPAYKFLRPHEFVSHWEHGSALVKLDDGAYRVKRGTLTDADYIRQLEAHVVSKHNALLMAIERLDAVKVMHRPQLVCADCWDKRNPTHLAQRIGKNPEELCIVCDKPTNNAIYVLMKVEWA